MPVRFLTRVAAMAATATVLASCSDGDAQAKSLDACQLVKTEDVSTHFSSAFGAPERRSGGGGEGRGAMTMCSYGDEAGRSVTIQAWDWPNVAAAEAYLDSFAEAGMGEVEAARGIGDRAIRVSGMAGGLHVRRGARTVSVSVMGGGLSDAADQAAEAAFAEIAASRL